MAGGVDDGRCKVRGRKLGVEVVLEAEVGEEVVVLLHVARDLVDERPPIPRVVLEHNAPALEEREAVHGGDRGQVPAELLKDKDLPVADLGRGHSHGGVAEVAGEGLDGVDALAVGEEKRAMGVPRDVLFPLLELPRDPKAHHRHKLPKVLGNLASPRDRVMGFEQNSVKVKGCDMNSCSI